jgi:tetratricopeptide (TPR) repeat protein
MNPARLHERASELFLELRALPANERADALRAACAGDEALAAEVASLLEHDCAEAAADTSEPALPQHIGPYRIVARLGSGSAGQVFLAEQQQPVRRRVAIKVVPAAAVSPELYARFELERAALEATDHAHIARVLDAGRTPDGLPYLVMNFVEGEPFTRYCERRELSLRARIELLLPVAEAVQHAHQRGVIHRDLKPANILVSEADGRPSPQVLDFGIAKPVPGSTFAASPPTLGLPLGTPAYMAPEQTRPGPVDTRADVYALGAILYELAAGRPPIDVGGDPVAALARLRESVPAPVSRARRARAQAASTAGERALLADLDLVLGKALEKDPDRRYASVDAFGEDLRHLLACEPVAARAPTWGYRAARFTRRHRLLVASAAVVLLAVAAGIAGLWSGLRETQRQQALTVEQIAAQGETIRFLTDDLLSFAAPDQGAPDLTVRKLLDRASARIESRLSGRPLVAAAIHHALGEAYAQLNVFEAAEHHLARAYDMRGATAGRDSPDTLHSEIALASLSARRERFEDAEKALTPALARARELLGPDDPAVYTALNDLGVVLLARERNDEALLLLEEALQGRRRLLAADDAKILDTLNNVALALGAQGKVEESLAQQLEALELARSLPDTPRMTLLGMHNNIGATLQDLGRNAEAEPHLSAAAAMAAEVLGPQHTWTFTIEANVAGLLADLGRTEEALAMFERVVDGQTGAFGPHALDTLTSLHGYWSTMRKAGRASEAVAGFAELLAAVEEHLSGEHSLAAQTEVSLAHALVDAGRRDEALPHAQRAEERLITLYGPDNPRAVNARALVATLQGTR